jgi:hypothetical protein
MAIIEILMPDFFEIDRLLEDLAKIYSTQCAVSWFKINDLKKPTKDEFRKRVTDFMTDFENSLSKFPDTEKGLNFKNYARELLNKQIKIVMEGNNKEVEKRYRYYAEYN